LGQPLLLAPSFQRFGKAQSGRFVRMARPRGIKASRQSYS
jgi:hypothetical protein